VIRHNTVRTGKVPRHCSFLLLAKCDELKKDLQVVVASVWDLRKRPKPSRVG
jgi:hypothetical protein